MTKSSAYRDHFEALLRHQMIEQIQEDVGKNGRKNRPLWNARLRGPRLQFIHDALIQKTLNQRQHARIRDLRLDEIHQAVLRDRIEVTFQISIDDVDVTGFQQFRHATKRVMTTASMTEAKAAVVKRGVEDWFDRVDQCCLHDSITNGGNAQRTLLRAAGFGDPCATDRGRLIAAFAQLRSQTFDFRAFTV